MTFEIKPHEPSHMSGILELTHRAWAPVFEKTQGAVPGFVYDAFYPEGWWARRA